MLRPPFNRSPVDELWISQKVSLKISVKCNFLSLNKVVNINKISLATFESEGLGRLLFRKVKIGFSSLPFTSTY